MITKMIIMILITIEITIMLTMIITTNLEPFTPIPSLKTLFSLFFWKPLQVTHFLVSQECFFLKTPSGNPFRGWGSGFVQLEVREINRAHGSNITNNIIPLYS